MWCKNNGLTEDEILRNRFTSYLMTAIQRRRKDYFQHLIRNMEITGLMDFIETDEFYDIEDEPFEDVPLMSVENQELFIALQQLGERERYVFINRVLEEKSYDLLAMELGLTYKGVSAIFYRALQKVRSRLNGG